MPWKDYPARAAHQRAPQGAQGERTDRMKATPFTSDGARALHDKARKRRAQAEVREIETRAAHEAAEKALQDARDAERDAFEDLKEAWETEIADQAALRMADVTPTGGEGV